MKNSSAVAWKSLWNEMMKAMIIEGNNMQSSMLWKSWWRIKWQMMRTKHIMANGRQGHQKNTALALAVVKLYLSIQVCSKFLEICKTKTTHKTKWQRWNDPDITYQFCSDKNSGPVERDFFRFFFFTCTLFFLQFFAALATQFFTFTFIC